MASPAASVVEAKMAAAELPSLFPPTTKFLTRLPLPSTVTFWVTIAATLPESDESLLRGSPVESQLGFDPILTVQLNLKVTTMTSEVSTKPN